MDRPRCLLRFAPRIKLCYTGTSPSVIKAAAALIVTHLSQVWQLILLQGVGVGVGAGVMYTPIFQLIPEWFSERRGLASGLIFSGTGVGGMVYFSPFRVSPYSSILDRRCVPPDPESHAGHYRAAVDAAHMGHRYRYFLNNRSVRREEPIAGSQV